MKKQAVVLIHGIGEQVPMDTLRGFFKAVWTTDKSVHNPHSTDEVWSKPDQASGDFELRRLTTAENREGRRTDFYEFYWAHMMEGTELAHLFAWAKLLIWRSPRRVPKQLRALWYFLVLVPIAIGLGLAAYNIWGDKLSVGLNSVLSVVGGLAWAFVGGYVLKKIVGDAARYLHVAPPNIESRRRIREAGIQLLHKLHTDPSYDRVIVVGHSLGTVIGYDILNHYWARCYDKFDPAVTEQNTDKLKVIEALTREAADNKEILAMDSAKRADFLKRYEAAQSAYFQELKEAGHPWRVTDFVTMGSPLAHAMLLMARTENEFAEKKGEREFPTCPPTLEEISIRDVGKERKFTFRPKTKWIPHHGAVFGPTRWSNLYFPCEYVVKGDVIGGRIAPAFGFGVRDIPVQTELQNGIFTHTLYWTFPVPRPAQGPDWIASLRDAVRICMPPPKPVVQPSQMPKPQEPATSGTEAATV